MLCSTSALLRPGHNLGLKSFNLNPSPRPLMPQQCETCSLTLPIGTPTEGHHTYTQYMQLIAETIKST